MHGRHLHGINDQVVIAAIPCRLRSSDLSYFFAMTNGKLAYREMIVGQEWPEVRRYLQAVADGIRLAIRPRIMLMDMMAR